MSRISILVAGLVAALALAAPISALGPTKLSVVTKLSGVTGPDLTITLKKGGVKVKTLKPGKYAITVRDKSIAHNFRLKGPGLNRQITSLSFKGTKTVTVTLKKGTYTYLCDPHASQGMKGSFRVV